MNWDKTGCLTCLAACTSPCTCHVALGKHLFGAFGEARRKAISENVCINQVKKAKNSIFDEISKEICGSGNHIYLANQYFGNRKSVMKEKLGMWLETVCHILNEYCIPCFTVLMMIFKS